MYVGVLAKRRYTMDTKSICFSI